MVASVDVSAYSCSPSNHSIEYKSLPKLQLDSATSNIPHLTDSDVDLHMPSDINLNYYTSSEFLNNQEITDYIADNAFSFLHCNIRSVSANLDNLNYYIILNIIRARLFFHYYRLNRNKNYHVERPVINLNLPGFQFVSQPSLSNAGGVGFYIQDKYTFSICTDLSKAESGFEVLWIEIENNAHSNLL